MHTYICVINYQYGAYDKIWTDFHISPLYSNTELRFQTQSVVFFQIQEVTGYAQI